MLAMLKSLGIEKGKPFAAERNAPSCLSAAAREAAATMKEGFVNRSFEKFWPDRQWQATRPENNFSFSYYGNGRLDYDHRAAAFAYWATWAPKRLADPRKIPATDHLRTFAISTAHCSAATNATGCASQPIRPRGTSGRSSPTKSDQRLHPQPPEPRGPVVLRQEADGDE